MANEKTLRLLIQNYWNRHGNFTGIEKTCVWGLLDDGRRNLDYCYQCLGNWAEDRDVIIPFRRRDTNLSDAEWKSAWLLVKILLTSQSLTITVSNDVIPLQLALSGMTPKERKEYGLPPEKGALLGKVCKQLDTEAIDGQPFVLGDKLFYSGQYILIASTAKKIAKSVLSWYQEPGHLIDMLVYEKRYHTCAKSASELGVTVAELFSLFDFTIPDYDQCYREFGMVFLRLSRDCNVILGEKQGISDTELMERINDAMSLKVLKQLNQF